MVMSSHYVPLVTLPSGGYLSRDDLGGRNPPLHCRRRVETILIFMLVALYYSCQSHPLEIRYDLVWADAIRPYNNKSHTREILTVLFVTWLHTHLVGPLSVTDLHTRLVGASCARPNTPNYAKTCTMSHHLNSQIDYVD